MYNRTNLVVIRQVFIISFTRIRNKWKIWGNSIKRGIWKAKISSLVNRQKYENFTVVLEWVWIVFHNPRGKMTEK